MALEVRYEEIRSNVIKSLQDQLEEMRSIYNEMNATVNGIVDNQYMVGASADNYVLEFTDPISEIFTKLNTNIDSYCMQLESVCAEFEKQDAEVSAALGLGQ